MGNGESKWAVNEQEGKKCSCAHCQVSIANLKWAVHIFQDDPKRKSYIFWHDSANEQSYTASANVGFNGDTPTGGVNSSTTIKVGQPLVKMFRREGESHLCATCFSRRHPTVWQDICGSIYGQMHIINVGDMKLVHPNIGTFG